MATGLGARLNTRSRCWNRENGAEPMRIMLAETTDCSADELIDALARVDERDFLLRLSRVSAMLEKNENDGPLFHRLGCALLTVAFVDAIERGLRPNQVRLGRSRS